MSLSEEANGADWAGTSKNATSFIKSWFDESFGSRQLQVRLVCDTGGKLHIGQDAREADI
jgi:hypothetical protein